MTCVVTGSTLWLFLLTAKAQKPLTIPRQAHRGLLRKQHKFKNAMSFVLWAMHAAAYFTFMTGLALSKVQGILCYEGTAFLYEQAACLHVLAETELLSMLAASLSWVPL